MNVAQSVRYEDEVSCLAFYDKDAEYFVISNCEGTLDSFLVDDIVQNPCQISIINHLVSATDFPSKNLNFCHQLFTRLLSSSFLLRGLLFRNSLQSMNLVLLELERKTITQSPSKTRLQHIMEWLNTNSL